MHQMLHLVSDVHDNEWMVLPGNRVKQQLSHEWVGHDEGRTWTHFPHYWSPVDSPHKDLLMYSYIGQYCSTYMEFCCCPVVVHLIKLSKNTIELPMIWCSIMLLWCACSCDCSCWAILTSNGDNNNWRPFPWGMLWRKYTYDGLVQERRNSIVLAVELCLSCTNLLIWIWIWSHSLTWKWTNKVQWPLLLTRFNFNPSMDK